MDLMLYFCTRALYIEKCSHIHVIFNRRHSCHFINDATSKLQIKPSHITSDKTVCLHINNTWVRQQKVWMSDQLHTIFIINPHYGEFQSFCCFDWSLKAFVSGDYKNCEEIASPGNIFCLTTPTSHLFVLNLQRKWNSRQNWVCTRVCVRVRVCKHVHVCVCERDGRLRYISVCTQNNHQS